jgi:hypothetical protein
MESLSVTTALAMIDNMSFEDSKRLKEILNENNIYQIIKNRITICHIEAKNEKEAIKKFIESNFYTNIQSVILFGKCLICMSKIDNEEEHLQLFHTHHEILNFHSSIFYSKYHINRINLKLCKVENILEKLNLDKCANDEELGNLYVFKKNECGRIRNKIYIRADNIDEAIDLLSRRDILNAEDLYTIHINYICKSNMPGRCRVNYLDDFILCEPCTHSICFICNKNLNGSRSHFYLHSSYQINNELFKRYILDTFKIKEKIKNEISD